MPMLLQPDGLIVGIPYHPSPHCNARPADTQIDLLVIHGISLPAGHFGGPYIDALFTNQLDATSHPSFASLINLQVSAHLLIRRDGAMIQYVPVTCRAWHAGSSSFAGRSNCNDYSIGIELEGTDEIPYEMIQYQQLSNVTRVLQRAYPAMTTQRIVGHADIAPGRKTDPGPSFDWAYYHQLLAEA